MGLNKQKRYNFLKVNTKEHGKKCKKDLTHWVTASLVVSSKEGDTQRHQWCNT